MTEYWKSQAKKYCDFCKCWIADNAPNVSFHDNGWKHKENVRKKISEMTRQSQKEYKTQLKVDDEMKKMEEAALKAYAKDIEASADITSRVIQETLAEKQKAKEAADALEKNEDDDDDEEDDSSKDKEEVPVAEEKKWYEAQSDEGYTYYWNVDTGESRWEPPEEGYVSAAEQKARERQQQRREVAEARRKKAEEERALKERAEEQRAWLEREKMKSLRKVEEEPQPVQAEDAGAVMIGPAPRADPYGGWTVVDNRAQKPLDLQLPAQEFVLVKVQQAAAPGNDARTKFKEKTVSSLSDGFDADAPAVGFKKRKLGSSTKKNARQRMDDDY